MPLVVLVEDELPQFYAAPVLAVLGPDPIELGERGRSIVETGISLPAYRAVSKGIWSRFAPALVQVRFPDGSSPAGHIMTTHRTSGVQNLR
ncbi:MAG: hypothetical protein ABFC89_12060 [Methanospirillum sp.]